MNRWLLHPAAKPLVFVLALLPLAWLVTGAVLNTLGANPAEALIRATGDWTLRLLCITLAVTPLRQITGWHALARLRRMLGLFTFFYALLHFTSYAWLDMGLVGADIVRDIIKRPFILVGSAALLLLLVLAATSFNRAIKALGAKRWQALHRSVYAIAALALLHFFWMRAGKNDFAEVFVYAAVIALLLGWRAVRALRGWQAARTQRRQSSDDRVTSLRRGAGTRADA
jgi:sulfoxide reductase heme-binding subunit YedZ